MKRLFIYQEESSSPQVNASHLFALNMLQDHLKECKEESYKPQTESNLPDSQAHIFGTYNDWLVVDIQKDLFEKLTASAKAACKIINKGGIESFKNSEFSTLFDLDDAVVHFGQHDASLILLSQIKSKPLLLDFENSLFRQRLLKGGRNKEAVARAVMNGLKDGALVFDATAGLGRESMILAHAGARVVSFERELPIWLILNDALQRASKSRYFPFALPKLSPIGTIKDYLEGLSQYSHDGEACNKDKLNELDGASFGDISSLISALQEARPEVIYYDPMFPERENSAQVKKDMFLFQKIIGEDKDIIDFMEVALKLATKRVVLKRPSYVLPLVINGQERSHFTDGGQCRFDCYNCS